MAPRTRLHRARGSILGTRSRILAFLAKAGQVRIPRVYRGARWVTAAAVLLLLVQLVTGILLSLYYYPEPGAAHESMRFLIGQVPVGWLIRGMHHWAGELLLVVVAFHMLAVFLRRAYARPREPEWIVGVALLLATLALRFTGRLLPWDEIGHANTVRGLELIRSVPLVGDLLAAWLQAGEGIGPDTLSRFFTTHVLVLPWLVMGLLAVHLLLVAHHGLREDEP